VKINDWIDGIALVILGAAMGMFAGGVAFIFRIVVRGGRHRG